MSRREADAATRAARIQDWKSRLIWLAIATAVLVVAILFRLQEGDRPAHAAAAPGAAPAKPASPDGEVQLPSDPPHDVMAIVNGKDISRRDLVDACVRRHGEDVLESMVNKRLIMNHCASATSR